MEQCQGQAPRCMAYGASPAGNSDAAEKAVKAYHHELCHLRILDPACGSGNFLYAYTRISLIQRQTARSTRTPLPINFRSQLQLNDPRHRDRRSTSTAMSTSYNIGTGRTMTAPDQAKAAGSNDVVVLTACVLSLVPGHDKAAFFKINLRYWPTVDAPFLGDTSTATFLIRENMLSAPESTP